MAMTNEQLTKWIDEIFGTIDEIKQNSGDISGLTRSVRQLREDVTALETDTAGTVSLPKAQLQYFTDGSATQALDLVADIIPVQAGTGDPAPDNVRAISGYSSIKAVSYAGNVFNPAGYSDLGFTTITVSSNDVTINASSSWRGAAQSKKIKGGATYFMYARACGRIEMRFKDETGAQIGYAYVYNNSVSELVNTPDNAVFVDITLSNGTVTNTDILFSDIMLIESDEAIPFEAYQANTATISLGSTVYSGTVNFTTGELTIDKAVTDLGDLTWEKATWADTSVFASSVVSSLAAPAETSLPDAICEKYKPVSKYTLYEDGTADNAFCIAPQKFIVIRDGVLGAGDAAAFKTAVTGVKLVAELATPITTTLTPAQLSLLQGENNVSATSGPITLTYAPDNVLAEVYAYIQKRFDTLTASLAAGRTTRKTTKTLTKKED